MATGKAIVEKALHQLRSTLTPEDDRAFADTTLEVLWKDAREIERDQGARLSLRHPGRLEPILKSLESYSSVIDSLCQGFSPMAWVWGPIKLMLLLARQHLNVTDKILQAFKDIAQVLPRVDRLKATFGDIEDFQRVLALIYSDILEFHRRVYKFFRRRAWHLWFAIAWGHFERRFETILGNLAAHCDLLDKEAAAVHFSEMKRMREITELKYEEFEQSRDNRMAQEVFRWLSAAEDSQEDYLHQFADARQPQTCNWILDNDQIFSWIEDENGNAIIWMTAIPGAGKSFLCSLLVENLENLHKDITTLYYFCKSSKKDSCRSVLCTLATQILRQNSDMAPLIHQAYMQKGSGHSIPAMKKMLKDVLSTIKSTRIVLDGIDECDYSVQKDVLSSLLELQKHAGDGCKLLVSSRFEPLIDKAMPRRSHIALDGKTTGALQLYIESKVVELKDYFPGFESVLFQEVEKRLKENAKGMFLWVRLVTSMLIQRGSNSEAEFENAIEQLPEGLDEAYGLILERISSLSPVVKEKAFKVLFWVCTAFRPIKMHEVADGIALKPGQTVLNKKTRCQDMKRDILEICAPIIERTNSDVLDLVHISAKEYLLHTHSGPFVDVAKAHFNIAFSCVTNLASASNVFVPRLSDGITEPEVEIFVVRGSYGLQSYGHQYWAEHVRAYFESISDVDDQAKILIRALDTFSKVRRHCSADCPGPSSEPTLYKGLQKLAPFPRIRGITADWLFFRSQLDEMGPFESLEAQQEWQLQKDETFLSLIDYRLREVTERLLTMDSSNLPTHIGKDEFLAFIERFGFLCRFHGCSHHFGSMQARSAHEATHVPSYPCLQCDFSERGFKSRKDLEKHTQKYHMSIEDFEIPTSLYTTDSGQSRIEYSTKEGVTASTRPSRCWNEQGREVLQRSFRQVLARLKSEITPVKEGSSQQSSNNLSENQPMDSTSEVSSRPEILSINLNGIQTKIEEQRYQSLTEFKDDIRQVSIDSSPDGSSEKSKRMEKSCDEELEKIFTEYPVFANFIPKTSDASRYLIHRDLSDDNYDSMQPSLEVSSDYAKSLESPGNYLASPKTPYWSSTEEKEFPKLLERYGREFIKISDYLKTKTADDVKEHFSHLLSIGRGDLSILADATDAELQLESQPLQTIPASTDISPEMSSIADRLNDSSQLDANNLAPPLAGLFLEAHPEFLSGRSNDQRLATATSNKGARDGPKRYRRPPRRVQCPFCNDHPNGLHNEHTLIKHIARYHNETRKAWICVDSSIDKNFLARCKKCLATKPYRSKLNAAKHLREVHFRAKTPTETLVRWMKEIEEKNPNFQKDRSNSSSTNGPTQLPRLFEALRPEENREGPDSRKDLNRLPALQNKSDQPDNSSRPPSALSTPRSDPSSDDKATSNGIEPDPSSLDDDMLLPNISFDNLLPGSDPTPARISDPGTFRANRALIRPDQVPRLPNLDQFQKAACQDQVDALHEILNKESTESRLYREAIEDLGSLSRTLRKRLMDWRRQSTFAPKIPYSV